MFSIILKVKIMLFGYYESGEENTGVGYLGSEEVKCTSNFKMKRAHEEYEFILRPSSKNHGFQNQIQLFE